MGLNFQLKPIFKEVKRNALDILVFLAPLKSNMIALKVDSICSES